MEKKRFGFLELRTQKLGDGFTRIELDFKGSLYLDNLQER
jgi:hypothetical protein